MRRDGSFGQHRDLSPVDRFGVWLSHRAVQRHARFDGARVADIGCGYNATLSRSLLGQVDGVTVVDLALAEDLKADHRVTAIEGSIDRTLPGIEDSTVDVTLCLSVLEHLWNPQEVLQHLHRITIPGGVVLVNVPSWRGKRVLEFSAFRLGLSPAEEMDDHKRYFDPRDLWPMLVHAGFKPSDIRCGRHKFGFNTFAACTASDQERDCP